MKPNNPYREGTDAHKALELEQWGRERMAREVYARAVAAKIASSASFRVLAEQSREAADAYYAEDEA